MKYAIPYAMPGRSLAFGTPLGAPLDQHGSRKRPRYPLDCDAYNDPMMYQISDPYRLAHSRRIIEIGALAVRNHPKIDPMLEDNHGMSAHERILKKVEDVERYLTQDERDNEDALKGCAIIREALLKRKGKAQNSEKGSAVQKEDADSLDVPSKMMPVHEDGLFGGCLEEDDLMSLLMRGNERLNDDGDAK